MHVHPNPAHQSVTLDLISPRNVSSLLSLYNADGRLISRRNYPLMAGPNQLTWDISHLTPGIYYCKLENTDWPAVSFVKE